MDRILHKKFSIHLYCLPVLLSEGALFLQTSSVQIYTPYQHGLLSLKIHPPSCQYNLRMQNPAKSEEISLDSTLETSPWSEPSDCLSCTLEPWVQFLASSLWGRYTFTFFKVFLPPANNYWILPLLSLSHTHTILTDTTSVLWTPNVLRKYLNSDRTHKRPILTFSKPVHLLIDALTVLGLNLDFTSPPIGLCLCVSWKWSS